ncbi:MAG TPA: hypothetical protein VK157_13940 [Phycisphaerales bacterium]|nr:hypothetical protein [Phycisphaerales bacterium]
MSVVRAVAVVSLLATVGSAHAELAYGITEGGIASDLVSFDTANPGLTTFVGQIANVTPGFVERAIDFRPTNGQLYMFATAPGGAYEI